MSVNIKNKPGSIVRYRERKWIVLPSDDEGLLYLKPLGGSEEEITAVFKSLRLPGEQVSPDKLDLPSPDDVGDFQTARMLFDASRLSFRNASSPFRCMGKLSFRPRSYQIVPLVMALKQDALVRLLIADDVGIGKTIEALIILSELKERADISSFAVICPPHLCEQWQEELKSKLDIDAEIIRSSTAAALDRRIPDDRSIFHHVPYQVISIDYIKAERRRQIFLDACPDLVIVDEAHTCVLPAGSTSKTQQQRYHLIRDVADLPHRHLLLLTATPHSGKNEEFNNLLSLINKEFKDIDFDTLSGREKDKEKANLARYFVQRKRENIKHWLKETTPFPDRDTKEIPYKLTDDYKVLYSKALDFVRGISKDTGKKHLNRVRYWAALALLRGIMSSPEMGYNMLINRKNKKLDEDSLLEIAERDNPLLDKQDMVDDVGET
jgi:superfamily II DNA or RNA helicase